MALTDVETLLVEQAREVSSSVLCSLYATKKNGSDWDKIDCATVSSSSSLIFIYVILVLNSNNNENFSSTQNI